MLIVQHSQRYYTNRNVPVEALYEIILDESLTVADYEIPAVTTDIPVTPCPAYATTTFTDTELKMD